MSTILITGANQGLGREAARRLTAAGHEVWAAASTRPTFALDGPLVAFSASTRTDT